MKSRTGLVLPLLLLVYLGVSWGGWGRYPPVWVDEGWIAEVGWSQAHGGPLGNPSHGALHRYADRLYWMPPLYFLGLSGAYRLGLPPLAGGRWVSLLAGACTLVVLLVWAKRMLGGPGGDSSQARSRVGPSHPGFWLLWLALAFTLDPMLWKVHRSIRFEAMTGLWLAAACATAWEPGFRLRGPIAGLAAGLSLLTHPTGLLALPAAAGVLVLRSPSGLRRGVRDAGFAVLAALLVALPYAVYLLQDRTAGFADVLGQNAPHLTGRGDPIVVQWLREWTRWKRYFAWPVLALPLLFWGATAAAGIRLRAPRALLWILGVLLVGLASLPNKSELYLTLLAPFLYLLASWTGNRLAGRRVQILALAWVAVLAAADVGLRARDRGCDYDRLAARLGGAVPEGASVAGTFVTWFAVPDHPYLEFHRRRAGDLADARPQVVIWGDRHLQDPLFSRLRAELGPWLADHTDTLVRVPSACYGGIVLLRPRWEEMTPGAAAGWERYGRENPGR